MEMLIFYWPNLLAGILIAAGLGLLGLHVIARNQALEAYVLGQEIQTSIILIAFVLIGAQAHSDHGLHVESVFSLAAAFGLHMVFLRFSRSHSPLRLEISVAYIFLLVALNNLLMSMSPLIEGHMVASLLGDIVTASRVESLWLAAGSAALLGVYAFKYRAFLDETIEAALFDRRPKGKFLTVLLLLFMGVSVHIMGLLFTISMLLAAPLGLNLFGRSAFKSSQIFLICVNSLSVILGFAAMAWFERAPTSVSIALWCFGLTGAALFINKFIKHKN